MVEHMVWIRFKAGVTAERQAKHLDGLRSLKGTVPGVVELVAGANFTDRAQGYTHGMLVRLTDRTALDGYLVHPAHVAVAKPLREDADLLVMDIEG